MAASDDSKEEKTEHSDESHSDDHGSDHQEEHHVDTKIDSPPGTYTMQDFAKYTKNNKKQATIKLDSLGITLNVNYIDGEPYKDDEPKGQTKEDYLYGIVPEWNYDLHGSDWVENYPNCADQFQSPINLIDPETKYGKTYDIYPFEDDRHEPTYWDLEYPKVNFDLSKYTVDVYIDHNHGYAGFESHIGE